MSDSQNETPQSPSATEPTPKAPNDKASDPAATTPTEIETKVGRYGIPG